jgi:hypothetical protein
VPWKNYLLWIHCFQWCNNHLQGFI